MKTLTVSKKQSVVLAQEIDAMGTPSLESGFLLSVMARSLVLLILTAAVALAFRRRSAAVLHSIWAIGLSGCLVLPVVTSFSPSWTVPLLPSQTGDLLAERDVDIGRASGIPEDGQAASTRPTTPKPVSVAPPSETARSEVPSEQRPFGRRLSSVSASQFNWPSFAAILSIVWLAGSLAVLSRLLYQVLVLHWHIRQASEVEGTDWSELQQSAAKLLGLRQRIPLKLHRKVASPMVTGLLRPVVVLPSDADTWSSERRELVLLHEFVHVKRRDLWTQTMATLACAVYWFNPLAWWGAHQMKQLREIACDDAVVTHGGVPAAYAQTLLDVAKGYRHRKLSGVVAMASSNQVEGRIAAILSSTRSRATLTTKSACALVAVAFVVAAVVGTCHLSSRAAQASPDEIAQSTATKKNEAENHPGSRTMIVRTLDETGKPLGDVALHANSWYVEGEKHFTPFVHLNSDKNGRAAIEIHQGFRNLRLWSSKKGYVPLFVEFADGEHVKGRPVPNEWEFRFPKGHRLGGRVVDDQGNPIANAKVRVMVKVKSVAQNKRSIPMLSASLTDVDFDNPDPLTDTDGRWSIDDAPAPPREGEDYEFQLQVTHPDFAGDTKWGEHQQQQGITSEDLRSGAAELVLNRGIVIHGEVAGPDGQPVSRGWVVWNDEPYFTQGVWETTIDKQGHFEIPPLRAGEYPITVIAPGYAAERRVVKAASAGMEPLRFQLKPGHRIVFHFVDVRGTSVPNVRVNLGVMSGANTWNNSNALHNCTGSNVPDYGVPREANEQGIYVWDWAPDGAVTYFVGAKGFTTQRLTLVPTSDPHIITLAPERFVVGEVTDASNGNPIEKFQAMPVIVFRPDFYTTRTTDAVVGHDGRYELPLTGSANPTDRYRVRFEADGYRSAVSDQSFGPLDGRATLDFALQPAPSRKGQVVDVEGRPVVDADVLEASPTDVPDTSNGRPESPDSRPIQTDASGNFQLHATTEPVLVRVYDDLGFAEKALAPEDESVGVLKLKPWAKVTGRLMQDGQPVPDQSIGFYHLLRRGLTEARFQDSYHARTDADGYFQFDRLPPISGTLKAYLGPWRDSPLTSSEAIPLELKPGEHREVVLGGDGATITGRVVATGRSNDNLSKQWSLNYLVSRSRGVDYPKDAAPLSFAPSGSLQPAWLRQPDFQSWVATRLNYFVKLSDDGQVRVHGVEPGEYDLVIQLYEEPAGCLVETIGEKVVPVTVTEQQAAMGVVDIGDIDVECRIGPRVGSDMRVFKFTDASGRVRHVDDMKGRYVLLHAWATWCAPCLESMPMLKATVEQLSDAPLTVVGLNVDEDTSAARAMAQEQGWGWAQNYLGPDSELMRQLAVSTIPAYYLVGPDGKLLGSANRWDQIERILKSELE